MCAASCGRAIARLALLGVAACAATSVCAVASHAQARTRLRAVAQVLAATAPTFRHKCGRAHPTVPSGTRATVSAGALHAALAVRRGCCARRARSRAASGAIHQIFVRTAHARRSVAVACAALGLGASCAACAVSDVTVFTCAETHAVARAAQNVLRAAARKSLSDRAVAGRTATLLRAASATGTETATRRSRVTCQTTACTATTSSCPDIRY